MLNQIQSLNMELGKLVENAKRSLVVIRDGGRRIGAGSIWHSDGLIVTNAHVTAQGHLAVSLPGGNVHPAKVIASDTEKDIAVLGIEIHDLEMPHLPTIELGDSRDLVAGQWAMALGHPLGVQGAVSMGVIIEVGSDPPEAPGGGREWVAASLSLRPGHSGGPLLDAQGRLVGINTVMVGSNVGLAVPVNVVKRFLKDRLGTEKPETRDSLKCPISLRLTA